MQNVFHQSQKEIMFLSNIYCVICKCFVLIPPYFVSSQREKSSLRQHSVCVKCFEIGPVQNFAILLWVRTWYNCMEERGI